MKMPKRLARRRRPERATKAASAQLSKSRLQRDLGREAPSDKRSEMIYPVVVYTKEELEAATRRKARRIVVKGELASKISASFKGLRNLSASSLNTLALVLSGAALFAPFTGGVSLGAAGTVMGTVGAALTASAIAAISAIGVALIVAVFKGYDEVKLSGGGIELVLRSGKRQSAAADATTQNEAAQSEATQNEAAQREAAQNETMQSEAAQNEPAQNETTQSGAAQNEAAQNVAGNGAAGKSQLPRSYDRGLSNQA